MCDSGISLLCVYTTGNLHTEASSQNTESVLHVKLAHVGVTTVERPDPLQVFHLQSVRRAVTEGIQIHFLLFRSLAL